MNAVTTISGGAIRRQARRQHSRARRPRAAENLMIVLAIALVLTAPLAGAVSYTMLMPGLGAPPVPSEPPQVIDEFLRTRVANVLFAPYQGETCREVKFKNDTGQFSNERSVTCYNLLLM